MPSRVGLVQNPQAILLLDIGLVIIVSQLASAVSRRLGFPGLIGAILGGVAIGPFALNLVAEITTINLLAFLGAVLILFLIGIEFEAEEFWRAGRSAFLLTTVGVLATLALGYLVGAQYGWPAEAAFLLGVVLAPSGTSIVAGVLAEARASSARVGSTALTAAVIDDVEGVLLLAIALSLVGGGIASVASVTQVTLAASGFLLLSVFLGARIFPALVVRLEKAVSDETLFALLLGLGMLLAFGATLFGLAAITGAFIMGAIIPAKKIGERLVHRMYLMKEIFGAIFFTAVGMTIDISTLPYVAPMVGLALAAGFFGRFLGGLAGGFLGGLRGRAALTASFALVARAEMSLIIAKQAVDGGLAGADLLTVASAVVVITVVATVPVFRRLLAQEAVQ